MRCRSWHQEAALRMLENNLHPDVAENPTELIVYGGIGKAARNRDCYEAIRRELQRLGDEETLLVQSGKPVGVFETHELAPRVLIANSNLVPRWATWEHFNELDRAGLMMYGQMTAGSWIYIGSQGIVQGTYETFAAAANAHFGGSLAGRLVLTAGLGGMGGAQPLAVTMNGGCALCVEVDLRRIERRLETGYLDERAADLDDALDRLGAARRDGRALSIGLLGNAAELVPELVRRGVEVDVVTDQTSAHDPLNGYIPAGLTVEQAEALRRSAPDEYLKRVGESAVAHVEPIRFQGLPARICWLGYGERHLAGLRFNEMVRSGELRGPIVIGRDHLDAGSVASPERETEGMRDGSDAVADWPILNALPNTACGASWVSVHHGGGVGMGRSIHAGQVCLADGSEKADERLRRTLTADPGIGVARHADAGYPEAIAVARERGVRVPMLEDA